MVRRIWGGTWLVIIAAALSCGKNVDDPTFNDSGAQTSAASTGNSSGSSSATSSNATSSDATSASASGDADSGGSTAAVDTSAGTTGAADTASEGCGDGVVGMGEQCDGTDLQGFTCEMLGLNGGTLACDPVMCTFDTSMCMSTTGGTSG